MKDCPDCGCVDDGMCLCRPSAPVEVMRLLKEARQPVNTEDGCFSPSVAAFADKIEAALTAPPSAPVGTEDHGVASPGEDPKPPHTPALRWLAGRDGVATQEWQDGFNAAYSYYAQQPAPRPPRGRGDTSCGFGPSRTAKQPAAVDGDYQRGLAFILAHRDAIIARCGGPSEQFVVERTFDALAAQPGGFDNG